MNLRRAGFPGILILIFTANALSAQAPARCDKSARHVTSANQQWKAPLGRTISLKATDVSLRDALNTLASNAGVRLSYNPDLIPLDRTVCMEWEGVPLGAALTELLRGVSVEPIVAGADQVVLTPVRSRPVTPPTTTPRSEPVVPLEPVVINVDAVTAAQRTHAFDVAVLDGRQLQLQESGTLAEVFNSAVAGVWAWPQSSSLAASYGSIRGASSFGLTYPKIYIDGIEVANPLLVRRISPESIERIEVIRGPGGAALYGADAISGVTNIITRHQSPEAGAPRLHIRSGFGLAASSFTPGDALSQDHMISLQTGSALRSAGLNVAFGSSGEIIPGADARYISADGSVRYVRPNSMVTGTLRFFAERTGAARSPLLEEPQSTFGTANDAEAQSVMQYTAGVRAVFAPGRWTHSLVLGADGYALSGVSDWDNPFASPADSALRAAGAGALRGTLRLSTSARFQVNPAMTAAVTLSADQSILGQHAFDRDTDLSNNEPVTIGQIPFGSREVHDLHDVPSLVASSESASDRWRSNTGVGAQFNAGLFERLFLTSGLRFEDSGSESSGIATLPMLGAAMLAADGPLKVKLRAAYGKGIRWPETATDLRNWYDPHMRSRFDLAPEQQHGIETGVDISVGRLLEMQVTRFDQTASGLFQRIAVTGSPQPQPSFGGRHVLYELQNVGEISNRGWEMQAALRTGRLSLAGALSLVDSRVQNLASGYTGDLRAGDRMLAVPERTISMTAAWLGSGWSTAWTVYRAANWVNYDRVGLANALLNSTDPARELSGDQLRTYWRNYDGFTHLRFSTTREIRPGLAFTFSGDNLLNRQLGEPDNITVLPGRTISLGVRASF